MQASTASGAAWVVLLWRFQRCPVVAPDRSKTGLLLEPSALASRYPPTLGRLNHNGGVWSTRHRTSACRVVIPISKHSPVRVGAQLPPVHKSAQKFLFVKIVPTFQTVGERKRHGRIVRPLAHFETNGPPPTMSERGSQVSRARNSRVVPMASPIANPSNARWPDPRSPLAPSIAARFFVIWRPVNGSVAACRV